MKAIFKKELRDLLPWIVVGMILITALCWSGRDETGIALAESLPIGFAAVAIAFGFLQTIGDMRTDAKGYLLHRPVSVRSVFWGKLLAGAVGYVAAIALPMIGLAIYQEIMGPEKLPTSPMKLIPSLLMSIVVFSFHPAAMWAVSRQARWLGTKAIPLAVPLLGWYLANAVLTAYSPRAYISLYWTVFSLAMLVTPVVVIAGASYAFCESQFLPPAQNGQHSIRLGNLGIILVCVPAVVFVMGCLLSLLPTDGIYPYTDHDLALSSDGQLWDFAQTTLSQEEYWNPEISVKEVASDSQESPDKFEPRPSDFTERFKAGLGKNNLRKVWEPEFEQLTSFQFSSQNNWTVYERDNRLLTYSRGLQAVVTPDGFYDSIDDAQGAFANPQFVQNGATLTDRKNQYSNVGIGSSLIYDENGVYQVDWKARTIRTVLDQPNEAICLVLPASNQDPVFWVRSGFTVTRYLIQPLSDDISLDLTDSELIKQTHTFRFPDIKTIQTDQWSFNPGADGKPLLAKSEPLLFETFTVAETEDGQTLFYKLSDSPTEEFATYELRGKDASIKRSGKVVFPDRGHSTDMGPTGLLIPPAFSAVIVPFFLKDGIWAFAGYSLLQGLLVVAVVFWLSRYYELSAYSRNWWFVAAITCGLATPLAMWIIYPRLIRERCHHCETMRRIDRARCQQCGADWARQPADGNEIIGSAPVRQPAASVS